jgi:hypothetical protein
VRETRSVTFIIRMRPTVKTAGEKAAEISNRSLSALMETLLIDHLKANGLWPPPETVPPRPSGKGKKKA